jgi:regulator of cell morphogenesis and NO signaling
MGTYINNTLEGNQLTVAQLAVAEPGALAVFTKYNIDYCCGGHRTLEEACNRIGLDAEKIRQEIYKTSPADAGQVLRPDSWTSAFLCDFIVENHHSFVRKAMPELRCYWRKFVNDTAVIAKSC